MELNTNILYKNFEERIQGNIQASRDLKYEKPYTEEETDEARNKLLDFLSSHLAPLNKEKREDYVHEIIKSACEERNSILLHFIYLAYYHLKIDIPDKSVIYIDNFMCKVLNEYLNESTRKSTKQYFWNLEHLLQLLTDRGQPVALKFLSMAPALHSFEDEHPETYSIIYRTIQYLLEFPSTENLDVFMAFLKHQDEDIVDLAESYLPFLLKGGYIDSDNNILGNVR